MSGRLPGFFFTAARMVSRADSSRRSRARRRRTGFTEDLGLRAATAPAVARMASSLRMIRALIETAEPAARSSAFLAKFSSHAVISSVPVKSSRITTPKGFPSFLEKRFSSEETRPASLKVPFSVASLAWAMVLYFPESKWPA